MARQKKEPNRVDDLLDELLEDCHSPEDILGESGLMKQIKKRLVERALSGELNHHLKSDRSEEEAAANSRNGSSKKTVQSEDGELELSIPRDRNGSFEPILVRYSQIWCTATKSGSLLTIANAPSVGLLNSQTIPKLHPFNHIAEMFEASNPQPPFLSTLH